jgi:hypothetical protein
VRAALVTFALLCAWCGIFMPFAEPRMRDAWPVAIGYCLLLAILVVGLMRVGQRGLKVLLASVPLAFCPVMFGLALLWKRSPPSSWWPLFEVSLYLLYAVLALTLCLAAHGWYLYFFGAGPDETTHHPERRLEGFAWGQWD